MEVKDKFGVMQCQVEPNEVITWSMEEGPFDSKEEAEEAAKNYEPWYHSHYQVTYHVVQVLT